MNNYCVQLYCSGSLLRCQSFMIAGGHQIIFMHSLGTHKALTKNCNSLFENQPTIVYMSPDSHYWLMNQSSVPNFRIPLNLKQAMVPCNHAVMMVWHVGGYLLVILWRMLVALLHISMSCSYYRPDGECNDPDKDQPFYSMDGANTTPALQIHRRNQQANEQHIGQEVIDVLRYWCSDKIVMKPGK